MAEICASQQFTITLYAEAGTCLIASVRMYDYDTPSFPITQCNTGDHVIFIVKFQNTSGTAKTMRVNLKKSNGDIINSQVFADVPAGAERDCTFPATGYYTAPDQSYMGEDPTSWIQIADVEIV